MRFLKKIKLMRKFNGLISISKYTHKENFWYIIAKEGIFEYNENEESLKEISQEEYLAVFSQVRS